MNIMTKQKVSPRGKLNKADLRKLGVNILKFTAPALAAFFGQLALGVEWKPALLFASYIFYALLQDFLSKLNTAV